MQVCGKRDRKKVLSGKNVQIKYCLVNGSDVSVELDGRSKENMEQLYREIRQILAKDGTFHVKKRTRNGYLENIIINATNITKVECINFDDKVTENN